LRDSGSVKVVGSKNRTHDGKKYRVLFGTPKDGDGSVEVSYRYNKEIWDEAAAKKHCADHDGKFEPAKKSDNEAEFINHAVDDNFISIVVNEDHNFSSKSVKVLLDRESGVKALICRLSGEGGGGVKMLMFPDDKFDDEHAIDRWLGEHQLSSYFIKQLLYTGRWEHPQKPGTWVSVTKNDITEMYKNVKTYLTKGGSIPVVEPPHPHTPVAKIDQTRGDLLAVFQWGESDLIGLLQLDAVASTWVREGKVKDVSPSIVYDVRTADGNFDVLFDHICITPDPYLIKQSKFQPLIAERYSKAVVFFENNVIAYENSKGGRVASEIQKALNSFWASIKGMKNIPANAMKSIKSHITNVAKAAKEDPPNFEEDREQEETTMTDEERKQFEALQKENDDLKGKLTAAETKSTTSEAELKKMKEDEENADFEAFKGEVEQLVKDGQAEPLERDGLIKQYETIKDHRNDKIDYGDTKLSVKDSLLAPFKKRPKKDTTKVALEGHVGKIRTKDGATFERESVQGRNQFADHVMKQISDTDVMAYSREHKVNKDRARAQLFIEKRKAVLAESTTINGGD